MKCFKKLSATRLNKALSKGSNVRSNKWLTKISILLVFSLSLPATAATPSLEEIWKLVQVQQSKIEKLEADLTSS